MQRGEFGRRVNAVRHQFLDGDAECLADPVQHQHGHVSAAGFELGDVALGDARPRRERALRHPPPRPQDAHAGTHRLQQGNFVRGVLLQAAGW